MRSSTLLSLVATTTSIFFASAAPFSADTELHARTLICIDNNKINPTVDADVARRANADCTLVDISDNDISPNIDANALSPRDTSAGIDSIPMILNDLLEDLGTVVDELNSIVTGNCTQDIVEPILQQAVDLITTAVSDIGKLAGQPLATILATVDSTGATVQMTVADLAQLLAKVLNLVVNALGALLKVAGGDLSILGDVVQAVGEILGQLVQAVLGLVDGLLDALLPLVGGLVGTLTSLAFGTLGGLLGPVL